MAHGDLLGEVGVLEAAVRARAGEEERLLRPEVPAEAQDHGHQDQDGDHHADDRGDGGEDWKRK